MTLDRLPVVECLIPHSFGGFCWKGDTGNFGVVSRSGTHDGSVLMACAGEIPRYTTTRLDVTGDHWPV